MAKSFPFAPSLLKENIFFLTIGTCISSVCILLFDIRLYKTGDVFLLFAAVLLSFVVQAFAGSMKPFVKGRHAALLYARSFAINFVILFLLYYFLLPLAFDLLLTVKFCILVSLIETSLGFFFRYQKQYHINLEKEKAITQAIRQQQVKEIEVLKQQIDPHFIFNSFNTLAFLIDADSDRAKEFSHKLAKVYRYIIFNSSKNLVALNDEFGFAEDYAYLQEIRHSNEVQIRFEGFRQNDNAFILPVSIQILLENAIKHNEFSEAQPLFIDVICTSDAVVVENKITSKNYDLPSSKIGLSNLRDRCSLIIGKDLQIVKEAALFKVFLPFLKK